MKQILLFEDVFGLYGGIEKVITSIIAYADPKEFRFSLYANHFISREYFPFLEAHHVTIYEGMKDYVSNPLKRHLKGYSLFRRFLKDHPFEVIHFNVSNSIDMKYVAIAKSLGVKNRIVHCHNDDATSTLKRMAHRFFKYFRANEGTYNIACSDSAGEWLFGKKALTRSNYSTIPNGIDTDLYRFSPANRAKHRKEFTTDDNTLLILHVGRFNTQKNQKKVVSVFAAIHEKRPDSKLVLFGDGSSDLIEDIRQQIHSFGIEDCVTIHPPVLNINEYYSAFDCFLFPSLYEGFGLVFLEAQMSGLNCIVSNTIPEIARVSPFVHYHGLTESDEAWAKDALTIPCGPHPNLSDVVDTSRIDIRNQINSILALYRKNRQPDDGLCSKGRD